MARRWFAWMPLDHHPVFGVVRCLNENGSPWLITFVDKVMHFKWVAPAEITGCQFIHVFAVDPEGDVPFYGIEALLCLFMEVVGKILSRGEYDEAYISARPPDDVPGTVLSKAKFYLACFCFYHCFTLLDANE
jgi:hypothetical protein